MAKTTVPLEDGWAVDVDLDNGGLGNFSVYRPDGEYYFTQFRRGDFGPILIDVRGRPAILVSLVSTIKHLERTFRVELVSFWFIGSARRISFLFSDVIA